MVVVLGVKGKDMVLIYSLLFLECFGLIELLVSLFDVILLGLGGVVVKSFSVYSIIFYVIINFIWVDYNGDGFKFIEGVLFVWVSVEDFCDR